MINLNIKGDIHGYYDDMHAMDDLQTYDYLSDIESKCKDLIITLKRVISIKDECKTFKELGVHSDVLDRIINKAEIIESKIIGKLG